MSFRILPIYPYRVWVERVRRRNAMAKAENTNLGGASKGSSCCGGGHDHPGHGHGSHRADGKAAVPEGTIYTCPMHPQIRQFGPGSCPICGMALEPEVASLDAPPNPELADMTRRFWVGLVLSLPAVVLEMGGHLAGGRRRGYPYPPGLVHAGVLHPGVLAARRAFFVRGLR